MVTASVERSGSRVGDTVEDFDLVGIVSLAGVGAGGFVLGQIVSDEVLPMVDIPAEPSNPSDYGAQILVKLLAAVVLVFAGSSMSDYVYGITGAAAFGALVSAGLDAVELGEELSSGNGGSNGGNGSSAPRRSPSPRVSSGPSTGSVRRPVPAGGSSSRGRSGGFRGT